MAKIFRDMKGYAKYDKSFICLPRQHLSICPEILIFQHFTDMNCVFTNDLPKFLEEKIRYLQRI